MQFFALAALFAAAMAAPADSVVRSADGCSGLYSNAQCCSPDVLGVACLDASPPSEQPRDGQDFQRICAQLGKAAKCCVVPVLGQDLLCRDAY